MVLTKGKAGSGNEIDCLRWLAKRRRLGFEIRSKHIQTHTPFAVDHTKRRFELGRSAANFTRLKYFNMSALIENVVRTLQRLKNTRTERLQYLFTNVFDGIHPSLQSKMYCLIKVGKHRIERIYGLNALEH